MTVAHCTTALVYLIVCLMSGWALGLAWYKRGRYWGLICATGLIGLLNSLIFVYLKWGDIVARRDGERALLWLLHDNLQAGFMLVALIAALVYLHNWKPPHERD